MPTVKPRESRKDFVSRCIPIVMQEGATQAHAVAKCNGIYRQTQNEERNDVLEQNYLERDRENRESVEHTSLAYRKSYSVNTEPGRTLAETRTNGRQKKRQSKNNAQFTVNRTKVVPSNPLKADPTRTTTLRRIFEAEFARRFARLKQKVFRLIVEQDAFGLTGTQNKERDYEDSGIPREGRSGTTYESRESAGGDIVYHKEEIRQTLGSNEARELREGNSEHPTSVNAIQGREIVSNAGRWAFQTDKRKVKLFEKWLKTQIQSDIITVTEAKAQDAYWRKFVQQGYEKGAGRAFDDVRKPALASGQEQLAFFAGTREEFLRQSFARPVAIAKVKRLSERVFTGLKDITDDMDNILREQLTQGLTEGMNPKAIARRMIKEGIGDKVRGVQSRAERIARTEIIRAHAEGQLDALEDLGVTEVGVMVEWSTAGDDRVCELCSALDGVVLTIKEARGILPRHPNCRCAHIPANIGESKKGQQRGKTEVKGAFDDSIVAERKKGSLTEKKKKSQWLGVDKTIARHRPQAFTKAQALEKLKSQTLLEAIGTTPKEYSEILEVLGPEFRGLGSSKVLDQLQKSLKRGKIVREKGKFRVVSKGVIPKPSVKKVPKPTTKVTPKKVPLKPKPTAKEVSASEWIKARADYQGMSSADKKDFQQISESVLGRMNQTARSKAKNIKIRFHATQESMDKMLLEEFGEEVNPFATTAGVFDYEDGILHSGRQKFMRRETVKEVTLTRERNFSHEMGHAIDHDGKIKNQFSTTRAWRKAWKEEMSDRQLSDYASVRPTEGFAEFARALFGPDQRLRVQAIKKFPLCADFWRKAGLL